MQKLLRGSPLVRHKLKGIQGPRVYSAAANVIVIPMPGDGAASTQDVLQVMERQHADPMSSVLIIDSNSFPRLGTLFPSSFRVLRSARLERLKVICVGANARELAQHAQKRGIDAVPAATGPDLYRAFSAVFESASRLLVGIASTIDFWVLETLDSHFSTALVAELRDHPSVLGRTMTVDSHQARYRLVSGSGVFVDRLLGPVSQFVVPGSLAGMGVVTIRRGAFADAPLRSCFMSSPLRSIGRGAFFRCRELKHLVLPATLEYLGRSAFAQCTNLEEVEIPRNVKTVGRNAFKGCSSLRNVTLSHSVESIGDDAFADCSPDLVLLVEAGSFAESWARGRGHRTMSIPARSSARARRPGTLLDHDAFTFRSLPGRMLEVISTRSTGGSAVSEIPSEVGGMAVRGIGTDALVGSAFAPDLKLPATLRWIAPSGIHSDTGVQRIEGLRAVHVLGRASVPQEIRRSRSPRVSERTDPDATQLSLRMVCSILNIPVSQNGEDSIDPDVPFTEMSAGVLTSSPGSLFFGRANRISEERIRTLRGRGVRMFVAPRPLRLSDGTPIATLVHPDPQDAYTHVCRWIGGQSTAKRIAVTGSVGKTTAKEFVRRVSAASKKTVYSKGNQNGTAQIGRYLQTLRPDTEVYVQETGAARPGLVEASAKLMCADAFIVTNIGMSHVENYGGSQENILYDKISHDRYLQPDGVAFLNYDDARLRELKLEHEVISYSIDRRDSAFHATDVVESGGLLRFGIREAATGETVPVAVSALGRHNVGNAVLSFAVGRWLGVPTDKIVEGIESYRADGVRQNLLEVGGQKVFADCYNASLESVSSALDALDSLEPGANGRRVFVFADIAELGEHTNRIHSEVGQKFSQHQLIDQIFCFGPFSSVSARVARERGMAVFHTEDREELHRELARTLRRTDVIAFKGSHGMALPLTIDTLFATDLSLRDGDLLQPRSTTIEREGLRFRRIRELGTELRRCTAQFDRNHLEVGGFIEADPVLLIGEHACQDSALTSVEITEPVRTVATSAFYRSRRLRHVKLPRTLRVISRSAFNSCDSLEELNIPDGVTTLGERAFFNCARLQRLEIPPSVLSIGAEAFDRCPELVIHCQSGSYVESFCRANRPELRLHVTRGGE